MWNGIPLQGAFGHGVNITNSDCPKLPDSEKSAVKATVITDRNLPFEAFHPQAFHDHEERRAQHIGPATGSTKADAQVTNAGALYRSRSLGGAHPDLPSGDCVV